MNHKTLIAIGQALYGNQWYKALADDLSVNVRTMRRWAANEFDIPEGVWPELADLCWKRSCELEEFAVKIKPELIALLV